MFKKKFHLNSQDDITKVYSTVCGGKELEVTQLENKKTVLESEATITYTRAIYIMPSENRKEIMRLSTYHLYKSLI